jgi:hypothetical protein
MDVDYGSAVVTACILRACTSQVYIFPVPNVTIVESEPFKTPDGREVRDHGRKGKGGEYIEGKGWKSGQVDDVVKDPADSYKGAKKDGRTGQGTTVHVDKKGNHVVVNDKGQVIAVNDRNNPKEKPPPREPEKPKNEENLKRKF